MTNRFACVFTSLMTLWALSGALPGTALGQTEPPARATDAPDPDADLDPAEPPPDSIQTSPADPEEVLIPGDGDAADWLEPASEVPTEPAMGSGDAAGGDIGLAASVSGEPEVVESDMPEDVGAHLLNIPTIEGPIGLFRVSTGDTAPVNHLRLGFRAEYFSASSVLIKQDKNLRLRGTFTVGYTPLEFLDVHAAFIGMSNRNQRVCEGGVCISEEDRVDPEVIKSIGDMILGGKYARPVADGITVGGQAGLRFLSSVSGLSLDPGATSVWFGGIASFDLKQMQQIPLRFHLNTGYYLDNSDSLQNFDGVSQPSQLVSSFAFGMAKDRIQNALAVDVPLDAVAPDVFIHPFAEYHLDWVTEAEDPAFAEFTAPLCGGDTNCVDNRDQQWVTLGVRALLPAGFTVELGVDVGVRSVGFPYGSPQAPYNIILGATLPLDLNRRGKVRTVTRTVTVEKEVEVAYPEGVATGSVVSSVAGVPVAGAVIGVAGRPQSRVATDPDGTFLTHPLEPGEIDLEITAPGFETQTVRAEIADGMSTEVRVALVPVVTGVDVTGRLTDTRGETISGTLHFSGPSDETVRADSSGIFSLKLEPGIYQVRADAGGYLQKGLELNVRSGFTSPADFVLRKRPNKGAVKVGKKALVVRGGIGFRGTTDQLTTRSQAVLDEVVDILVTRPEIRRLGIQTHTDGGQGRKKAMELTQRQAEAVASYLRDQGIDPGRLQNQPKGASQPRVPNIGSKNRRKNRRVVLRLL